ncbi:hypothetical protein HETIRDRAFT_101297 [Heterobasidion irregulare TC 32-1]|uniref:Uncharacterized protein n=1 Tax=Heterobasidion irregulare (strain TC 32-1) TaxID=747525 RepID=W4KA50_HETIT|nr:uncharacterized protein HETIRDRAFT_101297 [Heterobasidion irregulare TC 32-1]ETW82225.1 hypothetical protein HETIRDRAFT_101297 [Heterobasidion irregulare TC 32-1]
MARRLAWRSIQVVELLGVRFWRWIDAHFVRKMMWPGLPSRGHRSNPVWKHRRHQIVGCPELHPRKAILGPDSRSRPLQTRSPPPNGKAATQQRSSTYEKNPADQRDRPSKREVLREPPCPGAPIRSEGERYARELHAVTPTIQQNAPPPLPQRFKSLARIRAQPRSARAIPRRGPGDGNSAPSPRVRKAAVTKEVGLHRASPIWPKRGRLWMVGSTATTTPAVPKRQLRTRGAPVPWRGCA